MKKSVFIIFIFLLFPISLYSKDIGVKSNSSGGVKEYKLDNGLKVLIIEDHKAPLATFQIWYRVGSRNEPAGKTGLSHLLEHMMFKGTPKYGPKEFSKIVQKNGGVDNAFTTKDYTMYYQTLASDRIGLSIDLEADRMKNLLLDTKDVISERNVVMEERRMRYEDDPQNALYEEVIAFAFKAHPYHWPVIGWMSDIGSIKRLDLYNYYRAYYSPDNAVVIVSGDIKADDILKKIKASFGGIPAVPGKQPVTSKEDEQKGERRVTLKRDAELPYIIAAFRTPGFPDEDSYALEVLGSVLSGGKSARLYKSLVYEKKLALYAFADYSGLTKDPFLFLFGAAAAPGKDIKDVESSVYEEIEKIKKENPSGHEVQKAKNQIEAMLIMGQDSIYFQAELAGMFEMLSSWRLKESYLDGIRKVTPDDVGRVAKKYLTEENRTVGILIPTKKAGNEK